MMLDEPEEQTGKEPEEVPTWMAGAALAFFVVVELAGYYLYILASARQP